MKWKASLLTGELIQRTIEAMEEILEVAPESDRLSDGDYWETGEWAEAKSRLRKVLSEWKGEAGEDS